MTKMFHTRLSAAAEATETVLGRLLSEAPEYGEAPRPARLVAAMRYAVLGPGKRLRPFLLIESAALCGAPGIGAAVAAGAALECIHAYSLTHDDLPAMDNDDIRRGRATVHRAFDEATAILAGDGLLTMAFDILGSLDVSNALRAELVVMQARAAGAGGMVGGQALDLGETGSWDEASLRTMQRMKTGALFAYAAEAGAILGGATAEERERLRRFGVHFGAAFQLADDLDDLEKDKAGGRPSLAAILGPEMARARLLNETDAACACLAPFGDRAGSLTGAARFVARLS